ncbi:hypothetical protein [Streptomyces spiramyceticus]|uniref:NACHT N-terminal helical domain 7-containing protein n=1 Tax=Streptomyces spiramyceticus TaxID=299717 RepID=UPI00237B4719|nr:hypothetical protein [Streptomyces spiramyceticus]
MAGESSGAVADFCAVVRRLVRGCGVPQTELARALHRSDAAVSELLNGRRSTPPPLDDILLIVDQCRTRVGAHPPPGLSLDPAWWRARLAELEGTAEGQRQARRTKRVAAPLQPRVESITFDFADAVDTLVGGRHGFDDLAEELLKPLKLIGGAAVDLRGLFDGFGARVRAVRGTTRTALLCAADVVLLVTAFCDAVARSGTVRGPEVGDGTGDITTQVLEELGRVVLGSVRVRDTVELREEISAAYASVAETVHSLGNSFGYPPEQLAQLAQRRYERLLAPITWDCPELRLTCETYDPDQEDRRQQITPDRVGLVELGLLLGEFADAGPASAQQRERMRTPIASAEGSGPAIPSLHAGYVNPAFRVAEHPVGWRLAADDWWQRQPLREDIAGFLAAHLLTHQATQAPLLVLGHPGSGKSLLTRLIAARLPEADFFCLHVELRHIPADLELQEQLEEALFRSTGRRTTWPDTAGSSSDAVRVVLLDGFDELLQAGAGQLDMSQQWRYLKNVEQLQQRESELGRPVVFVVTSRTVVADQALTPTASTVIRLEPFDDTRIACWLEVWEATNRRYFASHGLEPLSWDVVRPHRDLASQPLLLLMLALYDAVDNPLRRLGRQGIHRVDLYERLLVEFVRRQVVKHQGLLPPTAEAEAIERELGRLGVIAIGMFNRRRQSITASEADTDLAALLGEDSSTLLFGRFFFVHEAQAVVAAEEIRSYEFLHATFGEYLVARVIGNELRRAVADGEQKGLGQVDDGCLYALLSFVPLTDRAEVLRNVGELPGLSPASQRATLSALLRNLFQRTYQGGKQRAPLSYRPVERNRIESDATYSANLLLLAVLAEEGVCASEFLATDTPVDRWWRSAQLWRSQFGEASWETFTRTLSLEHQAIGPALDGVWDLRISMRGTSSSADGLYWTLRLNSLGPTAYHDSKGVDASDLMRRLSFLCDTDVQQLLHALFPLLRKLPSTLRTYCIDENQHGLSAAHALVALVCRDTGNPEDVIRRYVDVLSVLQNLPDEDRSLVADVLTRHLAHDAALLPEDVVLPLLQQLIRLWPTDPGPPPIQVWPVLYAYVQKQMERTDLSGKQFERHLNVLVDHLHRYAGLFQDAPSPQDRLLHILRVADSTHVWQVTEHGPGRAVLDEGLSLLAAAPASERSPEAVIGLLRLARELGQEGWLAEHAEPMLLSLGPGALKRLRPSDVDSVRGAVHDTALLDALNGIEQIWRGRSAAMPRDPGAARKSHS